MTPRPAADPYRACPAGTRRGIDVPRMYPEITALLRADFGAAGVDGDDLIQETAAALMRKNNSANPYDPSKAAWTRYVHVVAATCASHLREVGGKARAAEDLRDDLSELVADVDSPEPMRTIGEIIAHLDGLAAATHAAARRLRRRKAPPCEADYQSGASAALRGVVELLGAAFHRDQAIETHRPVVVPALVPAPALKSVAPPVVLVPRRLPAQLSLFGAKAA